MNYRMILFIRPEIPSAKEALEHGQIRCNISGAGLKLKEYDEQPPNMLNSAQFVTKATYEKIEKCQRKEIGDEYADLLASTPQYLVGVDRTENVFDIVEVLKSSFENYDIQISYQLSGMKLFVKKFKSNDHFADWGWRGNCSYCSFHYLCIYKYIFFKSRKEYDDFIYKWNEKGSDCFSNVSMDCWEINQTRDIDFDSILYKLSVCKHKNN